MRCSSRGIGCRSETSWYPIAGANSGIIAASTPVSRARRRARAGSGPSNSFENSPRPSALIPPPIRSAETCARPGAWAFIWARVSGARSKPSCETKRSARRSRSGSSSKLLGATVRSRRSVMSLRPPNGSTSSPLSSLIAMALIVKSRRAMSSWRPMAGSLTISKSRCPGPIDRSARGGVNSMPDGTSSRTARSAGCSRTPTSWPCTSISSTRP